MIKKRGNRDLYTPIGMIPNCKEVEILEVTFQCDRKFSVHVKNKLIKANKSLYILRTLPKEGFNQSEIDPLFNTIVLPSAARLVSGIRRSDHITPVMKDLHWLPIGVRIDFKILLLTFKILNDLAPYYLTSLLLKYQPARLLRSSNRLLLPSSSFC